MVAGARVSRRSVAPETALQATVDSLFRGPPPDGIRLDSRSRCPTRDGSAHKAEGMKARPRVSSPL